MKNILLAAISLVLLIIFAIALMPILAPTFPFSGDDRQGPLDGYATAQDFARNRDSLEAIQKFMATYRPDDPDLALWVGSGALMESVPGSETLVRTECKRCLLSDGTPLARAFADAAISSAFRSAKGGKLSLLKDVSHRRLEDRRSSNQYVFSLSGAPSSQAVALTGGWYVVADK